MNKDNPQENTDFNQEILNRSWVDDSPLPPIGEAKATAEIPPLSFGQTAELPQFYQQPGREQQVHHGEHDANHNTNQNTSHNTGHSAAYSAARKAARKAEHSTEYHNRRLQRPAKSPYRNLALVIAGLFIYALLIGIASFVLGSVIYNNNADVADYQNAPLIIFMGAVFVASFMITLFSKGGTIFPSFALALIICLISILFSGDVEPSLTALFLKFGLSVLIVIISFSVAKACIILGKRNKAKQGSLL